MYFNKVDGVTDLSMIGNFRAQFYHGDGNFYYFNDVHPVQAMSECETLSFNHDLGDCGLEVYVSDVDDYRVFATYDSQWEKWEVDPYDSKKKLP